MNKEQQIEELKRRKEFIDQELVRLSSESNDLEGKLKSLNFICFNNGFWVRTDRMGKIEEKWGFTIDSKDPTYSLSYIEPAESFLIYQTSALDKACEILDMYFKDRKPYTFKFTGEVSVITKADAETTKKFLTKSLQELTEDIGMSFRADVSEPVFYVKDIKVDQDILP